MGWAVAIFGEAKWTAKARAAFEATPIDVEAVTWPEGFAGGAVEPGTTHARSFCLRVFASTCTSSRATRWSSA